MGDKTTTELIHDDAVEAARAYIDEIGSALGGSSAISLWHTVDVAVAHRIVDRVERAERLAAHFSLPVPWTTDGWRMAAIRRCREVTGRG